MKSTAIRLPDNSAHKWTPQAGATATYPLDGIKAGKYRVLVWRLPHTQNIRQMNYKIWQGGEESYLGSVALQPGFDDAKAAWVEINPEIEVTGKKGDYIIYTCEGVNCRACLFKLVPIK